MNKTGIYGIENIINGKVYGGQAIDFKNRKKYHFNILKNNKHKNSHLQNAYNKYGKESFIFKILIYCEPFELTRYEQFFVDYYKSFGLSYNIRECVDSNLGFHHSEESKKKMSIAKSGENNYNFGKHHTEETKRKISKANSGKNNPMYGNHCFSGKNNPFYGKQHSEETKEKISKNHADVSGNNNPNYGKHLSDETKAKISNSHIGLQSGENNPNAKLKKSDVLEILDLFYNKNTKKTSIYKLYNVCPLTIKNFINGRSWKNTYENFIKNN